MRKIWIVAVSILLMMALTGCKIDNGDNNVHKTIYGYGLACDGLERIDQNVVVTFKALLINQFINGDEEKKKEIMEKYFRGLNIDKKGSVYTLHNGNYVDISFETNNTDFEAASANWELIWESGYKIEPKAYVIKSLLPKYWQIHNDNAKEILYINKNNVQREEKFFVKTQNYQYQYNKGGQIAKGKISTDNLEVVLLVAQYYYSTSFDVIPYKGEINVEVEMEQFQEKQIVNVIFVSNPTFGALVKYRGVNENYDWFYN